MPETKKCAHPSCNCAAKSDQDYCSTFTFCEGRAETADFECSCGHGACAPDRRGFRGLAIFLQRVCRRDEHRHLATPSPRPTDEGGDSNMPCLMHGPGASRSSD